MTRLLLRPLALLAAICAVALAAGFAAFVLDASRVSPWPGSADGIVVLTGGTQRVDAGVGLLRAGVARRLLISGVPPGVTLPDIMQSENVGAVRVTTVSADTQAWWRRVTLGHAARSTEGNAVEVAWWAHANAIHSLVVVTAGYHMRRAMADIGAVLPDVRLQAYAVHPGASPRTLAVEYLKLLAAHLHATPRGALPETT